MYRTNEAALAGEVVERQRANDPDGMLDALRRLWLAPPEQRYDDPPDPWVEESWQAVCDAKLISPAVRLAVELVKKRERIRPRAFVHVVQNIRGARVDGVELEAGLPQPIELDPADAHLLLEMTHIALQEGWDHEHYVGAVFVKLVEGQAKRTLWPYLQENLGELRLQTPTWLITGLILATTSMGTGVDLVEWLQDFPYRGELPMWVAAMYIHFAKQRSGSPLAAEHFAQVAAAARANLIPDDTETYLLCVELEPSLRRAVSGRDYQQFIELTETHAERFASRERRRVIREHPIVQYLNRLKTGHPVDDEDFEHDPDAIRLSPSVQKLRVNYPIAELCKEMGGHDADASRAFHLFRELLETERGDKARVTELYRAYRSFKKPKSLRWMNDEWQRLLRKRAGLGLRLKFAFFG